MPTGLADVDSFFNKVQSLLDDVQGAQDGIREANTRLRAVLGIGADAKLGDALAGLKEQAKGAVKVKMEGGKPKVTVEPGASPQVSEAVGAVNGLVAALAKAIQALAAVPQQAQVLIAEAKSLPGKIPTLAKEAGLGIAGMGGALKAVKHNVGLTVSIPKECGAVGKEAIETFKAIGGAFS